jgi:hypothetical protein
MAKFISFDGVDKNGIRAEVTVQTGTGRIKEIVGRGKQNEDGSYRNVEIVFDPDNPLLKRKVYGLLDTNASELWEYIKNAMESGQTVSYRIESQRRNGVDRKTPIGDLNATEQVRRILASVDTVFSHEAKTNPAEDPSDENPSALAQNNPALSNMDTSQAQVAGTGSPQVSSTEVLASLVAAKKAGFPDTTINVLAAYALANGSSIEKVSEAVSTFVENNIEERPYVLWNSDGKINHGSYAVQRAAEAEQFALDHLIEIYTPAKSKTRIDVTDEIVSQAASVALQLLQIADNVQLTAYGATTPDRMKNSYARALSLVLDAVGKRYPVPVGGGVEEQKAWALQVAEEASERLYGISEIAVGRTPKSQAEREGGVESAPAQTLVSEKEVVVAEDKVTETESKKPKTEDLLAQLGGTVIADSGTVFVPPASFPTEDSTDFVEPDAVLIGRLKTMCENAEVIEDPKLVSNWMERILGMRVARKIHAPVLADFCEYYEKAGREQIRLEVLQ